MKNEGMAESGRPTTSCARIPLERGLLRRRGKPELERFLAGSMDEQGGAGSSPRTIFLVATPARSGLTIAGLRR